MTAYLPQPRSGQLARPRLPALASECHCHPVFSHGLSLCLPLGNVNRIDRGAMLLLFPALPFFFVWALARAQSTFERATILFVALVAPLAFFASDPLHLKLLAYIPGLSLLVEPLGYQSIIALQERPRPDLFQQLWSVGLVMRRYESWTLAAAGLGLAVVAACRRSSRRAAVPNPDAVVVTVLFGSLLLSHFAMYSVAGNVKWVAAYFASFAALGAVVLGVLAAWVWHRVALEHPARAIAAVAIAVGLTISVAIIRHPLLPTQRPRLFEERARWPDPSGDTCLRLRPEHPSVPGRARRTPAAGDVVDGPVRRPAGREHDCSERRVGPRRA